MGSSDPGPKSGDVLHLGWSEYSAGNINVVFSNSCYPKKEEKRPAYSGPSQGKIAVLVIFIVLFVTVGAIVVAPYFEIEIGLSVHETNFAMQTLWTALILVSIWFRTKGKYFLHEIIIIVVVFASLVSFSLVLLMSPLNSGSLQVYSSSPLRLIAVVAHAIFSISALIFGVWFVALWRPGSISIAAKSKRIAQITTVPWVLSYVAGVLSYAVLHTTFFG